MPKRAATFGNNVFDKLPIELNANIFSRVLDSEQNLISLLHSCKVINKIVQDPIVCKEVDVFTLVQSLPTITGDMLNLLNYLAMKGNFDANLLVGTYIFFNMNIRSYHAIQLLKRVAESKYPLAKYILAIAQIIMGEEEGELAFIKLLQDDGPKKENILRWRSSLKNMVEPEQWTMLPMQFILCTHHVGPHWSAMKADIQGVNEFDVTCEFCSIEVEFFKLLE